MGSPISPIFADIVMEDLERDCSEELKNIHEITLKLYKRYVDDTFLIARKDQIEVIFEIFNNKNKHLKFTHEIETNNRINFLDITILKEKDHLITNWYQKPTQSTRILNFNSNHTLQLKKNVVYNLIDRAILLSHHSFHKQNLKIVEQISRENEYPKEFIETNIKKRICRFHSLHNNHTAQTDKKLPLMNISIPYHKELISIFSSYFKKFNIGIVPKINNNLSNIIRLGKDSTKKWCATQLVYKFSCKNCPTCYIGETKRTLAERIHDHRTRKHRESVVSTHMQSMNHEFDWCNVVILDHESNYRKRIISEMIYINSNMNTINKKEDTQFLSNSYKTLFQNIT